MLFKPSLIVKDVTRIDLDDLKSRGISGLMLDLDNTVMVSHTCKLEADIAGWLSQAQAKGFGCVIVSNNKRAEYCRNAEGVLGFPVVFHAKKPSREGFDRGLKLLGLEASQVAVVGDRALTDIWGGLRLGAYTILVDSLNKDTAPPIIKFGRMLEGSLIKRN